MIGLSKIIKSIKERREQRQIELEQSEKRWKENARRSEETRFRLNQVYDQVKSMDKFGGNLQEYNEMKGERYEILDVGLPEKQVIFEENGSRNAHEVDIYLLERLVSQGCLGFIHCRTDYKTEKLTWQGRASGGTYDNQYTISRGVPVKKVNS